MQLTRDLRFASLKRTLRNAPEWVKNGPRLASSVFLMLLATQAMGSEALKMVYELHSSDGGTHVVAIFEDGAAYHARIPKDSPQPDGCTSHRTISLWWMSGYDYAKARSGEPAIRLDPEEVRQHWRNIIDDSIEYASEARHVDHSSRSCAFAVVTSPIKKLTEMRLIQYNSRFFLVRPRSVAQRATVDWLGKSLGDLIREVTADSLNPRLHHPIPTR